MKLPVIILALTLVGCSALPQKFDSTELMLFTEMNRAAKHLELACGNKANVHAALEKLYDVGEQASFYTHSLTNDDSKDFLIPALHMMDGLDDQMSETFCKETALNMQAAYGRVAKTLGRRQQ